MPRGRPRKQHPAPQEQFNGRARNAERLDELPALANEIDDAAAEKKDATSGVRNIYKRAELDGFHARALKEAIRLRNLDPAKRRDYLSSLNDYCDKLGIWDQSDMIDPDPRPPVPPEDDDPFGAEFDEDHDLDPHLDPAELAENTAKATAEIAGYNFETGRQAGLKGENLDTNPWPDGTKAQATWAEGWNTGQAHLAQGLGQGGRTVRA